MKTFFSYLLLLAVGVLCATTPAHANSYRYESIDADITIHPDATFTVRETQTYRFDGEFHKGWREIPLRGVSAITDIVVYDYATGLPLAYTPVQLEKTDPASWGKYTYRIQGGQAEIEWYYTAQNEQKTWVLEYTVIGGISFLKEIDELYWNIFTDYAVPVERSFVTLKPPAGVSTSELLIEEYLEGGATSSSSIREDGVGTAEAYEMQPGAKFTVAFGFPRGAIDRGAFWQYLLQEYFPYLLAVLLWAGAILFSIGYWYYGERHNTGRGTIVAEYEPPDGLPPAVGECILKEKKTKKTWPATLVDLAVRGFVRFEEEKPQSKFRDFIVMAVFVGVIVWQFTAVLVTMPSLIAFVFSTLVFFFLFSILYTILLSEEKEYRIVRIPSADTATLRPFEKKLLDILFLSEVEENNVSELAKIGLQKHTHVTALADAIIDQGNVFSTRAMKMAPDSIKMKMAKSFKNLEKEFYTEIASYGFHTGSLHTEKIAKVLLVVCIVGMFGLSLFLSTFISHWSVVVSSLVGSVALVVYMVRYEVKLTKSGEVEKERWLGFKEFLYRTERYRVQELTPDTFQKYLPYAMVFGIEKKWAKRFEHIATSAPQWYKASGSMGASGTPSGMASNFSAGAFSASLSSSFASAFSTSSGSGGGASSGGGSAGGGGGGGGGGAS